ncbi:hypothetical protein NQ318_019787 [Aromia moschata]|uniref:Single-pass membrane and coiled-coil domain-containing protein 4 homolog n=1 Tax=Aromia moschata TaxID=1265417 RepID=A0AAV8YKS7_9CUCU|nr:hypothetical protein NQ318_019787 [Aromia moschata]
MTSQDRPLEPWIVELTEPVLDSMTSQDRPLEPVLERGDMRQLKGGKVKESAKEKKQRKKEFAETQKQVYKIALPALVAVFVFIVAYVYMKTRPRSSYID